MTDENNKVEELPFQEQLLPEQPQLTVLRTNISQVNLLPSTGTQGDADTPYSSSEDSPSQSRRYIRAGLDISFAEFHQNLTLRTDTDAAAIITAAEEGLIEQAISPSTTSTWPTTCSPSSTHTEAPGPTLRRGREVSEYVGVGGQDCCCVSSTSLNSSTILTIGSHWGLS
jgi:hypothetical protein